MTHIYKFVNNPPYRDWGPSANQSGEVIKMWYINIYSNIIKYQKYLGTLIKLALQLTILLMLELFIIKVKPAYFQAISFNFSTFSIFTRDPNHDWGGAM